LWPSARSMAATVEESTPPDIATAMVGINGSFHYRWWSAERGKARAKALSTVDRSYFLLLQLLLQLRTFSMQQSAQYSKEKFIVP
jgi:hypothetical protein